MNFGLVKTLRELRKFLDLKFLLKKQEISRFFATATAKDEVMSFYHQIGPVLVYDDVAVS